MAKRTRPRRSAAGSRRPVMPGNRPSDRGPSGAGTKTVPQNENTPHLCGRGTKWDFKKTPPPGGLIAVSAGSRALDGAAGAHCQHLDARDQRSPARATASETRHSSARAGVARLLALRRRAETVTPAFPVANAWRSNARGSRRRRRGGPIRGSRPAVVESMPDEAESRTGRQPARVGSASHSRRPPLRTARPRETRDETTSRAPLNALDCHPTGPGSASSVSKSASSGRDRRRA